MQACPVLNKTLSAVLREALNGRAQDAVFLDDGEPGVLDLLDNLPAEEAGQEAGGFCIAMHARHVAHSLRAYARAVELGEPAYVAEGWPEWEHFSPSGPEWAELCGELRARAEDLMESLERQQDYSGRRLELALGALAHLSFHFGIVRVKYDLLKGAV